MIRPSVFGNTFQKMGSYTWLTIIEIGVIPQVTESFLDTALKRSLLLIENTIH